jgi:hypothetical protein
MRVHTESCGKHTHRDVSARGVKASRGGRGRGAHVQTSAYFVYTDTAIANWVTHGPQHVHLSCEPHWHVGCGLVTEESPQHQDHMAMGVSVTASASQDHMAMGVSVTANASQDHMAMGCL